LSVIVGGLSKCIRKFLGPIVRGTTSTLSCLLFSPKVDRHGINMYKAWWGVYDAARAGRSSERRPPNLRLLTKLLRVVTLTPPCRRVIQVIMYKLYKKGKNAQSPRAQQGE
jgi:hypothetical protein